jgi:hypothetical protein
MDTLEDRNTQKTKEMLDSIKDIPQRSSRLTAQGKAQFLREARLIHETVSQSPLHRLNNWIVTLTKFGFRKERSLMKTAISAFIVAIAVVIGGGGITAYAAQDSLPNEMLYPLKLFIEDAQYNLTSDSFTQIELLTTFANNRVDEIAALEGQEEVVPAVVMVQLQTHLQTMMKLAAGMDGETLTQAFQQIRTNLRTQAQLMTMLGQPEEVNPALEQLRAMLENQHRLAQQGLEEPLKFKQEFGKKKNETPGIPPDDIEPAGNQNNDCIDPGDCTPMGEGNQNSGETVGSSSENGTQGENGGQSGSTDNITNGNGPSGGDNEVGNPAPGSGGNDDGGNDDGGNGDSVNEDGGNGDGGNGNDSGGNDSGSGGSEQGSGKP